MLQICSGKLFKRDIEYRNNLRGVIYTNLTFDRHSKINTSAGSILSTSSSDKINALFYEVEELIESTEQGSAPGILISHTLDPYISDFSTVLSFALNCTASPSYALVDRLLGNQRGISTQTIPNRVVNRVFNSEIYCTEEDERYLTEFVEKLIGLKRQTYLGVMRAIRTYITAIHRISDDFELAYTLLVASIESLAQDFDNHKSSWNDYDQKKKNAIDFALSDVDEVISKKVRQALLDIEHTSLGRRFKEFTLEHINPSYYREDAEAALNPISKHDLPKALSIAYQARSKYVHNLEKLPKQLTTFFHCSETYNIKDKVWLSIQGLSRLVRHVITNFILKQETIDKEPYNYLWETYGVMGISLPPSSWIANTDLYRGSGSKKLEGFLAQLVDVRNHSPNPVITDLKNLLEKIENDAYQSQLKKEDRLSYIALYILYNSYVPKSYRTDGFEQFTSNFKDELFQLSPEAILTVYLLGIMPSWNTEDHYNCLLNYFKTRDNKLKFRAPEVFEAGMILQLAERYRIAKDYDNALRLISMAVETYPGHTQLRQLEIDFQESYLPIEWENIFLIKNIDN